MKTYTLADIRALRPCYDPGRYLPENWTGTILDGLRLDAIPAEDRIWVAIHLLDDRTNRLFAVWCAREALKRVDNPDPRSIAACDVAERFADSMATEEELAAARAAAYAAHAAWSLRDAASTAAWAAASAAASTGARAAASTATWDATWDATWAETWDAQIQQLIRVLEEVMADEQKASGMVDSSSANDGVLY